MNKIWVFIKKYRILLLVLLAGVFFRTYKVVERFEFAHDGDLYSWIAKDILVDHHLRLIGQLTTAAGIYIGPFFYYLLTPFYYIFNMDPIAALVPVFLIGLSTILSYYYVFSRVFNKQVGLIITFLYSVLLTTSGFDRWVVPTVTTPLWSVWYFYILFMILKKDYSKLWILGILIGMIWHIHLALIPTLLALPFAIGLSKKLPNKKQLLLFIGALFISNLPLVVFEFKHNFSQFHSLISNFEEDYGGGKGIYKLMLIIIKISSNTLNLYFMPHVPEILKSQWFAPIVFISIAGLLKLKLLNKSQLLVIVCWVIGPILFFTFSSAVLSEYYFSNLYIIFLLIPSLWIYYLYQRSNIFKVVTILALVFLGMMNAYYLAQQDYYPKGYLQRKAVAQFIKDDAQEKGYPCISLNYITAPGENVGFRYFFWLNNLHVNHPDSGSPIYHIVLPEEYSDEVVKRFGHIGVIVPKTVGTKEEIKYSCSGQNSNLTDPMFGYTD